LGKKKEKSKKSTGRKERADPKEEKDSGGEGRIEEIYIRGEDTGTENHGGHAVQTRTTVQPGPRGVEKLEQTKTPSMGDCNRLGAKGQPPRPWLRG